MPEQKSYTKYANNLLPSYRDRLNKAESTEDVKKFFVYTVQELLLQILPNNLTIYYEDIILNIENEPYYLLSENLAENQLIQEAFQDSDLDEIINRMAKSALKRYQHLQKNPEKTESKIRHP